MQSNQNNKTKNIEKILTSFSKLGKLPKALIKYGCLTFFVIFVVGTVLVLLNNTILPYNSYFDMVSKEIVKTSFVLAAEFIIGGLIMDYVIGR